MAEKVQVGFFYRSNLYDNDAELQPLLVYVSNIFPNIADPELTEWVEFMVFENNELDLENPWAGGSCTMQEFVESLK